MHGLPTGDHRLDYWITSNSGKRVPRGGVPAADGAVIGGAQEAPGGPPLEADARHPVRVAVQDPCPGSATEEPVVAGAVW